MGKLLCLFLLLHGAAFSSQDTGAAITDPDLYIPHSQVNKWVSDYDGRNKILEIFVDQTERLYTLTIISNTPLSPGPVFTRPPNEAICIFSSTSHRAFQYLGSLSYYDPISGSTLFLTPF